VPLLAQNNFSGREIRFKLLAQKKKKWWGVGGSNARPPD